MTTNVTFDTLPDEVGKLSTKLDLIYQFLVGSNFSLAIPSKNEDVNQFLLLKQACKFLQVSEPTLYRYRKQRKIATYKDPETKKIYFKKQELIDYIQNGKCRSKFEIEQDVLKYKK